MCPRVCPWWLGWMLDNPLRSLIHPPRRLLAPHVSRGMTVLDVGSGTGFFTRALARLVGANGKVYAVDLQAEMLERLNRRAQQAGLAERIVPSRTDGLTDLTTRMDFVLAFWMMHEVSEPRRLLQQIFDVLKPGGHFMLIEPKAEVSKAYFQEFLVLAESVGLRELRPLWVALSRAAVFERPENGA